VIESFPTGDLKAQTGKMSLAPTPPMVGTTRYPEFLKGPMYREKQQGEALETAIQNFQVEGKSLGRSLQMTAMERAQLLLDSDLMPFLENLLKRAALMGHFQIQLTPKDLGKNQFIFHDDTLQMMLYERLYTQDIQAIFINVDENPVLCIEWGNAEYRHSEARRNLEINSRYPEESADKRAESFPSPKSSSFSDLLSSVAVDFIVDENWRKRNLVFVNHYQSLEKALERLNRHNIQAMPVINQDSNTIIGVLDLLDILNYMEELFPWDLATSSKSTLESKRWEFLQKSVGDILVSAKHRTCPIISEDASLATVTRELATGEHCILVVPRNEQTELKENILCVESVSWLVTQSDIVRFLARNVPWMTKNDYEKSVGELGLIQKDVLTVSHSLPTVEAFKLMHQNSLHGVGVTDDEGKLIASLSASNIKGITRRSFHILRLSVGDFLRKDRQRMWWFYPICVKETDSLKQLILLFVATQKHRVYLVDSNDKPIGVITLTDVLNALVTIENLCK